MHAYFAVMILYLLFVFPACTAQGCIYSRTGKEYAGSKDRTRSGKNCQRWDSEALIKQHLDVANFPDRTLSDAGNYCRNPDNSPDGPWCFTADPDTKREACGIQPCDCKTTQNGEEYIGHRNYNTGGRCQRWESNTPNIHEHHDLSKFPDRTLEEAKDYCRNPDSEKAPWCYKNILWGWDYCSIPNCVCRTDEIGNSYIGELKHTKSGIPCKRWEHTQYRHSVIRETNFCRNPNQDPDGPWCYTTDPDMEKESCDVPRCYYWKKKEPIYDGDTKGKLALHVVRPYPECRVGKRYNSYSGTASSTISGKTCQRWDSQRPHIHRFTDAALFPDANLKESANYCRNPDGTASGPWCYTTDPRKIREACPIKHCECKITRSGSEYAGKISRTQAGRSCQRWDTQSPHKHNNDDPSKFPDPSLAAAANFCRNPDESETGPWCYTTESFDRWDFCRVPMCSESMIPKERPKEALSTTAKYMTSDEKLIRKEQISQKTAVFTSATSIGTAAKRTISARSSFTMVKHGHSSDSTTQAINMGTLGPRWDKTRKQAFRPLPTETSFLPGVADAQKAVMSTSEYIGLSGFSLIIFIGMFYLAGCLLKRKQERVSVNITRSDTPSLRY